MRKLALFVLTLSVSDVAFAECVAGYFRQDGTYVSGYCKSDSDQYRYNNWSSESLGGTERDEFSENGGATNKSNPGYGLYDNDGDGTLNGVDLTPEGEYEFEY